MGKRTKNTSSKRNKKEMKAKTQLTTPNKVQVDAQKLQQGLAKLTLTIVELLRQVLERQAQRRIEEGTLTQEEVERLGLSFMQIKQTMEDLAEKFGLKPEELRLGLDSILGLQKKQQTNASLADLVDTLLSRGTVIGGEVIISVADVDLVALNLLAVLSAIRPLRKGVKKQR